MIFYFSGTGNSGYVAEQIAFATKEKLVYMSRKELDRKSTYVLEEGEILGFVFPIYWWGMPKLVEEFVREMKLQVKDSCYVFGVATFGLGQHNGLIDLKKELSEKGITLQAAYEVKMVDNYVVGYDVASKEKQDIICQKADEKIREIIADILERKQTKIVDLIGTTIKPIVHSFYKGANHRKKFFVTEKCSGCGLCERQCPCQAIAMENGKPIWEKDCSFCLKCIHSCPAHALQYGKGTVTRGRYLNHMG